ncbi:MAG: cytochrome c, partial [Nitrospira sp.]|nr:cytochrome c [Nitrospira sp.]
MKSSQILLVSSLIVVLGTTQACSQNGVEPAATGTVASAPAELRDGEQKFNANCSRCHGIGGVGTQ